MCACVQGTMQEGAYTVYLPVSPGILADSDFFKKTVCRSVTSGLLEPAQSNFIYDLIFVSVC
jgi:hypothetical protein